MNPKMVVFESQQILQQGSPFNPRSVASKVMARTSIAIEIDKYDVV